jgi:hypothetical protein
MNLSSPRKSEGKKSLKSSVQIFSLLLISSILFSCATPAVKTTTLIPARFHEATKLKEVAVLPFDGQTGREFAAEIEGTIASINVDNKQYFTLIKGGSSRQIRHHSSIILQYALKQGEIWRRP